MLWAPTKLQIADPVDIHGWPPPASGGPEDKEGLLAEPSVPASSNFCRNQ